MTNTQQTQFYILFIPIKIFIFLCTK